VAKYDPSYTWSDTGLRINGSVETVRGGQAWTGYILNMTSQTWLTPEDSSRPVWWHMMAVIIPDALEVDSANADWSFLWITGGNNEGDSVPSAHDEEVISCARLAVQMSVVTVALFQVPNQHIVFSGDAIQKSRSEDAIIACK
jgi:PhoPQ-activated pathogenicity-related protein